MQPVINVDAYANRIGFLEPMRPDLATVQGIVAEYGGAVVCDSVLGRGTTFHVYLPASGVVAGVVEERDVAEGAGGEHILLVDDEPILADLGRAMLERAGYRVTSRTSSLRARGWKW